MSPGESELSNKSSACQHTPTEASTQLKIEVFFSLSLFLKLTLFWGHLLTVLVARNKRGRGEGIHAFFPRRESLFGNRMNTHVAHSFRSMRSHRAHSLSAESEAVSSESDNREWQCALVSGYWLKKGGVCVCGVRRASACFAAQPVEQDRERLRTHALCTGTNH